MAWPTLKLPEQWHQQAGVRVALAASAGIVIGFLVVPTLPKPEDPRAPPPAIVLLGEALPSDDTAAERALDRVRAHVSGALRLQLQEQVRTVSYSELGVSIDTLRLTELVKSSRDATSPLRRVRRRLGLAGAIELPLPLVLDEERTLRLLRNWKDELDRSPLDARVDVEQSSVLPEQQGRKLDVDATLGAIARTLEAGSATAQVVFREQRPRRTSTELKHIRFDQVLGFFETQYDRSEKAQARTFNLRHAAEKLAGTVLMPGEVFDFNQVVGPRDEAHGYQVAPVIAEGELVDGIGGGTCQISGTLHGAAFFAGLEIVERYPHTRPSAYIKLGLDATVVYPTINFRFKNTFAFPVVVQQTVSGGKVRAEIRGAEVGPAVTLIRRIESATTYEQIERPDPRLARGKRVLLQRGVPGFRVKRYRVVRDGEHAVRDAWNDTYPATTQLVLIGTRTDDREVIAPSHDPHPEYLADELLVITKQRATAEEPTRLSERREPGRFGEEGWTKAAQMPFFEMR